MRAGYIDSIHANGETETSEHKSSYKQHLAYVDAMAIKYRELTRSYWEYEALIHH